MTAVSVELDEKFIHVRLADGDIISAPIDWFPTLLQADRHALENFEIGPGGIGIYWPDVDEDLSLPGLAAWVGSRHG